MLERKLSHEINKMAQTYPVVTITGPRQSGKTTLVKHLFPNKAYINLEAPDVQATVKQDPRRFFNLYPDGAILDEIQKVPELLSYIQVIVDERQANGMFILTGSHQLQLHEAVSQSLAGRTAMLKLLPLSLTELKPVNKHMTVDEYLFCGGFPRAYQNHISPPVMFRDYVQTYLERDVRQVINVKDLGLFQNFLQLCAGRCGQLFDQSNLANEVGVSSHTIKDWLSALEASFIIFRLQPYYENLGKRVIKTPKIFFTDVGLVCYLLGVETIKELSRHPLRGYLFENLVILELIKARLNEGKDPHIYFYRDSNKNEVDVIFKQANSLIPIEIKSAETFNKSFLKGVEYFRNMTGERSPKGFIVYAGSHEQWIDSNKLINFKNASKIFEELD